MNIYLAAILTFLVVITSAEEGWSYWIHNWFTIDHLNYSLIAECNLDEVLQAKTAAFGSTPILGPILNSLKSQEDTCKKKEEEKGCLDEHKLDLTGFKNIQGKCGDLLKNFNIDNVRNQICEKALNDEERKCKEMKTLACKVLSGKGNTFNNLKDFMVKKAATDKGTEVCKNGVSKQDVSAGQSLLGGGNALGGGSNPLAALGGGSNPLAGGSNPLAGGSLGANAGAHAQPGLSGLPAGFPNLNGKRRKRFSH